MKRGREDQAQSGQGPPGKRPPGNQPRAGPNSAQQTQSKLTTNDALTYLREVKNRFSENKEVYDTFLEIMKEFKAQRIDTAGVISRVKNLFRGHRELILGFNTFLPRGYEIELARAADENDAEDEAEKASKAEKTPVEFDQAINYVNKIKTRFASDERVYKAFLEILNMYRKGQKTINNVYEEVAVLFASHNDLLDEFTYFLPDNTPPSERGPAARMKPLARGMAGRGPSGRVVSPSTGGDFGARSMHKRKAAKKADEGYRGRNNINDDEDYRVGGRNTSVPLSRELAFFDRVKQRIKNRDAYQDFLKCLNLYSQDIISRHEMVSLVNDIIGRCPDLVSGFQDFLAKCEVLDLSESQAGRGEGRAAGGMRDSGKLKPVQKDKFLTKPLSELVVNETERVTPSYVKIPGAYPKLPCTGRSDVLAALLNDQYCSVTSGSEDYSFKLMRKNQYEEAMFRCEDDRYEFEMTIETSLSALKALRPISEKISVLSGEDRTKFQLEEGELSSIQLRAIEHLYGEQGMVLCDLLRKNPAVAVPVVLARLEQKEAEWRKVREEMTRIWRKIYEQNYHKSLDHRSFYFKQFDKKALMPKSLVAEVRDAAERRKADEAHLRCLSLAQRYNGAARQPADLEFDCSERSIFQDCFEILRTAICENLGLGVREQVLELYLKLVEPFFGLPERTEEISALSAVTAEEAAEPAAQAAASRPPLAAQRAAAAACAAEAKGMETDGTDLKGSDSEDGDGKGTQDDKVKLTSGSTPEPSIKHEAASMLDSLGAIAMDLDIEEGAALEGQVLATRRAALAQVKAETLKAEGGVSSPGDGDEESSDEHPGRTYEGCKPLTPYAGLLSNTLVPGEVHNVLFGNENIYLFFRFHRHLFDRLWTARRCCSQKGLPTFRQTGAAPEQPLSLAAEALARDEASKLHTQFMGMVQQLLLGEKEASVFEDQCRALLGTGSYELFTLDKLINKLVKHMHIMVADEQTCKLWELYKYEKRRRGGVSPTVYHVNCHAVIDESAYRFEYRGGAPKPALTVQLVDSDKVDLVYSNEGFVTHYIRGYVSSSPAPLAPGQQLFMPRNLPASSRGVATTGSAEADAVVVEALACVHLLNGLECKIACANSKVSYVLDTEDVLCRKRNLRKPESEADKQRRIDRFSRWLEETMRRAKAEEEALVGFLRPTA